MLNRIQLLFFLAIISPASFSQNKFRNIDYSNVDMIARTIQYDNDLFALTNNLTSRYSLDIYKVRAIFIWITENMNYDYKLYNSGKEIEGPNCEDVLDCSEITKDWETKYLKKILKQKKAVCDGYSRLFKRMCDIAGIESEIISGYARTEPWQIGSSFTVNHSWNAVRIDSAWYFLDATWAAGYCTKDPDTDLLNGYVKNYENYYWLTPPEKLNRNHYPEKGKWAYENNFTKEKFTNNPYYAGYILDKINLLSPNTGVIKACYGDTIHFKFTYEKDIDKIQVNSNAYSNPPIYREENISKRKRKIEIDAIALKRQQYITPTRKGNMYEFDYPITNESLYYLDLLFNYRRVMRFRVQVKTD